MLESKYGGWRSLNEALRPTIESIWWRDLKILSQYPQQGQRLNISIVWKVGRGDKFKFWEDTWTGGHIQLSEKYPRLYNISDQQNQLIQHMGVHKDTGWE